MSGKNKQLECCLLNEVKRYIERMEEMVDGEWGGACRSAETMIATHSMPDVYWKIVQAIERIHHD